MITSDASRADAPYRSANPAGRDGFPQLLRAEFIKFRTVRGWVIAMVAAAALICLSIVALAGSAQDNNSIPRTAIGPNGEAVTDSFFFVHQALASHGSLTVRVASLTGNWTPPFPGARLPAGSGLQPWAKAGITIKASTRPGSRYAAIMVTPEHGVRFQFDFTGDTPGLTGAVSPTTPRWLRLTRAGDVITGYDSPDGRHWDKAGAVRLAGFPATAQAGLFATSPDYDATIQGFASNNGEQFSTTASAVFDQVAIAGGLPGQSWRGAEIGAPAGTVSGGCPKALRHSCPASTAGRHPGLARSPGGVFTVTGSGDIAPFLPIVDPIGLTFKGSLVGLIAMITLAALFVTSEYRRGLIRTTFTASPRRGRVLVAKAIVIGSVTFVAGLVGAVIAFPIAEAKIRAGGWPTSIYPVRMLISGIGLQFVLGTAALLAIGAVLTLGVGALLRRSAGAIAAAVVLLVFPLVLATVLPQAPAQWLLRLTPAAAFGLQQGNVRYSQVAASCLPYNGCYPLAPWVGFAVLCAWAIAALGAAIVVVRRRDA